MNQAFSSKKKFRFFHLILWAFEKKIKRGIALVYFPKNDANANLPYGTTLMLQCRILPMRTKGNPGQFDFAAFYQRQGIYYQVYIQEEDYIQLPGKNGNSFNGFLFWMKNKIKSTICFWRE